MGMTDQEFASRLNVTSEQIKDIADGLKATADPRNAQFVLCECTAQGRRGVIMKIPAKGSVFFSLYTYAESDFRPSLRKYLSDKGIVGQRGGFSCVNATDKANTSNGTVCDFLLDTPIMADKVRENLQTLIGIKSRILELLEQNKVLNIVVGSGLTDGHEKQEMQTNEVAMNEKIKTLLTNVGQVILHGAPGTGKTYMALQIAAELTGDSLNDDVQDHIKKVQFHEGYDYSDFVLGLKPQLVGGTVSFEWKSGVFKKFVEKARVARDAAVASNAPIPKFVFIIDEINRADLSRVFGELFSLIEKDYRYPAHRMGVDLTDNTKMVIPDNLYIIGTMNDIDRSVESMDFALRRRFAWVEIDAGSSKSILDAKISDAVVCAKLKDAMDAVNKQIVSEEVGLSSDYQIGGAIFANYNSCANDDKPFERLWDVYIETIVKEYLRGNRQAKELVESIKSAYETVTKSGH